MSTATLFHNPYMELPVPDAHDQERMREWFAQLGRGAWFPLRASRHDDSVNVGIYCALAPPSYRSEALSDPGWDLLHGSHGPGFSQGSDGSGGWITTYHRVTSDPLEPLVVEREFHGIRPAYVELSEEFRLYHNLYADPTNGQLLKFDDAGNEHVAAQVGHRDVLVLTPLVRQFQAAKQMDLLLFIDSVFFFEPGLEAPPEHEWRTSEECAVRHVGDAGGRPFSRFLATRVLIPPSLEHAGIWPYEAADESYPLFIIGTDDLGNPEQYSCDPDGLANYFGSNPEAPHYLTPVHFRRDVLVRYYDRPDLYTVEDGYLRCGGLWGLRMDNDVSDTVVVWLGDLGRDLPASERGYWRSFNVAPAGTISETAYKRAILGEWASAQSVDLQFRVAYKQLQETWRSRFGWSLLLDPEPADAHLLDQVRRPLHNTEAELEDLVRTLAKLLVDSLNEAELARPLSAGPAGERGIAKLERWFEHVRYPHAARDITFLRNLQTVRSKAAAHRKGSDYERALDRALGPKRGAAAGNELLVQSMTMLRDLISFAGHTNDDAAEG